MRNIPMHGGISRRLGRGPTRNGFPYFPYGKNNWSLVPADKHEFLCGILETQICDVRELQMAGMRTMLPTEDEYEEARQCLNCAISIKAIFRSPAVETCCIAHSGIWTTSGWTCCGTFNRGCRSFPGGHRFSPFPSPEMFRLASFAMTPPDFHMPSHRRAVALDCEMVGANGGTSILAFVAAIDYLTGETLLHRFVTPSDLVDDWRTEFSGITEAMMFQAIATGATFENVGAARAGLWEFVGPDTIIIGHALQNDLSALRLIHPRCIDSALISKAVSGGMRTYRLRTLCADLIDSHIQGPNKSLGHDALEDALAARELVMFCGLHPDAVTAWGLRQIQEARAVYLKAQIAAKKKDQDAIDWRIREEEAKAKAQAKADRDLKRREIQFKHVNTPVVVISETPELGGLRQEFGFKGYL